MRRVIFISWLIIGVALLSSTDRIASGAEIAIVGTGAGASVLEKVTQAFMAKNPGVFLTVPPSIGSGGGVKAVGNDENVIGRLSRPLKDTEKGYGLTYLGYAKLPIIFYVNSSSGVSSLTSGQVVDIYSGKVKNWREVGGPDARIRVIRREDGDSSLEALQKTVPGFKNIELTKQSKTTYSDPETLDACAETPGTIAFGAYPDLKGRTELTPLALDGKKASSADYPFVGELGLIYKEENNTGKVATFIEYVASGAANDVLSAAGAIPIR
jgi:phosphate transport system substrate-binding protein